MLKYYTLVLWAFVLFFLSGCTGKKPAVVYDTAVVGDSEEAVGEADKYESGEQENEASVTGADYNSDVHGNEKNNQYAVYVCGAVVNPGVYYLDAGSIRQDALDEAGGFCEGAARWYVNLAEEIVKGEKIYIPFEEELDSGTSPAVSMVTPYEADNKVNINTADKQKLMSLPGIGESRAAAIITYREQNGPFTCTEDICKVDGIKSGLYGKIKDLITVN